VYVTDSFWASGGLAGTFYWTTWQQWFYAICPCPSYSCMHMQSLLLKH
jgi:hypothetical protein